LCLPREDVNGLTNSSCENEEFRIPTEVTSDLDLELSFFTLKDGGRAVFAKTAIVFRSKVNRLAGPGALELSSR